jgi:hypothetical protein
VPLSLLFEEFNDLLSALFIKFDVGFFDLQINDIQIPDVITIHKIIAITVSPIA